MTPAGDRKEIIEMVRENSRVTPAGAAKEIGRRRSANLGEGGEGVGAKSLILLGEGSGEGGEGCAAKSLKTLRRRLAKVAKHRTPIPLGRTFARLEAARFPEDGTEAPRPPMRGDASRHHLNCEWQFEQYAHECTCGLTAPKAPWFDRMNGGPDAQPV